MPAHADLSASAGGRRSAAPLFRGTLNWLAHKKGVPQKQAEGKPSKKLFTRAKLWGVTFAREPQWKRHWLAEPQERVRELVVILERTPPA